MHRVVCVGRRARDPFLDAADDYGKRLGRYAQLDVVRLRDATPEREAEQMLAATPPDAFVVALDERGEAWDTQDVCTWVGARARGGPYTVVYYIGGADGLGPAAKARARRLWALSPLTLPHRAALALLVEQLYRVHTVLNGEHYHRP